MRLARLLTYVPVALAGLYLLAAVLYGHSRSAVRSTTRWRLGSAVVIRRSSRTTATRMVKIPNLSCSFSISVRGSLCFRS
jgi:hypothetical protein